MEKIFEQAMLYDFYGELLNNLEVNIGLKECHLNLFKSSLYIILSKLSLAAEILENVLQFF